MSMGNRDKDKGICSRLEWFACRFVAFLLLCGTLTMLLSSCASKKVVVLPSESVEAIYDTTIMNHTKLLHDSIYVYRDREVIVRDSVAPIIDSENRVTGIDRYHFIKIRENDTEYRKQQESLIDSLRRQIAHTETSHTSVPVEVKSKFSLTSWLIIIIIIISAIIAIYLTQRRKGLANK